MGNTSVKGHDVDDHGPTLVTHHVTSYTSDSDNESKVCFVFAVFCQIIVAGFV